MEEPQHIPLKLAFYRSRLLEYWVHLLHAAIAILFAAIVHHPLVTPLAILVILLSWRLGWQNHLRPYSRTEASYLLISKEGRFCIQSNNPARTPLCFLSLTSYRWLGSGVILYLRSGSCSSETWIFAGDSMCPSDLRLLCMRLLDLSRDTGGESVHKHQRNHVSVSDSGR